MQFFCNFFNNLFYIDTHILPCAANTLVNFFLKLKYFAVIIN